PTPALLFEIVTFCLPIELHRHRRRSVCPISPSLRVLDIAVDSSARVTVEVPDHSSFEISNAGCFSAFRSLKLWNTMSNELSADMSKKHTGTMSTDWPTPLRSAPPLRVTAMRNRYLYNWAVYFMKNLICGPILLLQSFIVLGKELGRQTMPALCEEAQDQRSSRRFSQGHINNTYANASQRDPKILMTTTWDPSAPLIQFAKVGLAFFLTYHIIQISFAALLCRMFCDATWQPILRNDSRIILLCNICFRISTLDVH
ncbi:hypothetical protein DVH24_005665, partial [Malus domestica]